MQAPSPFFDGSCTSARAGALRHFPLGHEEVVEKVNGPTCRDREDSCAANHGAIQGAGKAVDAWRSRACCQPSLTVPGGRRVREIGEGRRFSLGQRHRWHGHYWW